MMTWPGNVTTNRSLRVNPKGDSSRPARQYGAVKFGKLAGTSPNECQLKVYWQDFSLPCFQPGANCTKKRVFCLSDFVTGLAEIGLKTSNSGSLQV